MGLVVAGKGFGLTAFTTDARDTGGFAAAAAGSAPQVVENGKPIAAATAAPIALAHNQIACRDQIDPTDAAMTAAPQIV